MKKQAETIKQTLILQFGYSFMLPDRLKDSRWTIRRTEWQAEGLRSVGRPKRRWRDDIVGQQGSVWTMIAKDRERWKTGGGLLLQWKDTA